MTLMRIFLIILLATGPAFGQSLPDRYMVTNVADDDVLNIRAEPNASSPKIGELHPYTLNVEVLRTSNGWGYIGAGERSGWVSMNYLAPNALPVGEIPRPLSCSGTEPFWDVTFYPRGTDFNAMGEERRPLTILRESVASNGFVIDTQDEQSIIRTMIISGLACNDGMFDSDFGMTISMFTETPNGNSVNTGCCTMQVN